MKKYNLTTVFLLLITTLLTAQPPFKTGINFPFRNPETTSLADYLSRLHESGTTAMRQMTYADVYWHQVEPVDDEWDFSHSDSAYFNPYGITSVGELFSIMGPNDQTGIQVPWEACSDPNACYWDPASDSLATKDYISTVINRYKDVTSYWEITNEFEHVLPPEGLPLNAKKDFLQYCYRWVKQADPSAQVLLPGMLGTYGYPMENTYDWLNTFLDMGGGHTFDIMNYHDYNAWWTLPAHLDSIRAILDNHGFGETPIWITETSISSVNISPITPDYSSPDEQAADVWRRLSLLWAHGAEVAFWHSHWSSGDLSGWGEFGLLNSSGQKKKSFYAFQLLMEKVAAFSEIEILEEGEITTDNDNGGNGIWLIAFTVNDQKKWLIWSPDQTTYLLTGINTPYVLTTRVVPLSLSDNGEEAVFEKDSLPTTNGSLLIDDLSSLPLLIEETSLSSSSRLQSVKSLLSIYPNPVHEKLFVKTNRTISQIEVYNPLGKLCLISKGKIIDTTHWPAGMYYLSILLESGERKTTRIIKR